MIENESIVELENGKKYMIIDSSIENQKRYYFALEVDYVTEEPKEEFMFFEGNNDSLSPITSESDIIYLKTIFIDKFIDENIDEINEEIAQ